MYILDTIVAQKRIEVAQQQQAISFEMLQSLAATVTRPTLSMREALQQSPTGIIAEFKRKSPSKGWNKESGTPAEIPSHYAAAGAAAISILTDEPFFGGELGFIRTARPLVNVPILRKDFIISPYQLFQARVIGADAVLLIAACLTVEECRALAAQAHELGLEVLLEIHSESEQQYVSPEVDMVGVNNRNLGTFHTDVANSFRLASLLPKDRLLVSESGISDPTTIRQLRDVGFRGFLIGETFMKTDNPGETLKHFIAELQ